MAKGRKRLIAGWTLLAVAGVMAAGVVASRWWMVDYTRPSLKIVLLSGIFSYHHDWAGGTRESTGLRVDSNTFGQLWWSMPEYFTSHVPQGPTAWRALPIAYLYRPSAAESPQPFTQVAFVVWPIAAFLWACSCWPLVSGMRARRRSRLARSLCPTCGYDLSATPATTFPTCPECGTAR